MPLRRCRRDNKGLDTRGAPRAFRCLTTASQHPPLQVSSTSRTCLPQGADLLAIGQILAAQTAAERTGAAMDGRLAAAVAGADLSSVLPPALAAAGSGRGRWAGVQRGAGGPGGSASGAAQGGSGRWPVPSCAGLYAGALQQGDLSSCLWRTLRYVIGGSPGLFPLCLALGWPAVQPRRSAAS